MKWVRPCTIVMLVAGVTAGFFIGKIDAVAFFGFATGLAVWWFKSRDQEKENGTKGK